jgi:hypothetical protein
MRKIFQAAVAVTGVYGLAMARWDMSVQLHRCDWYLYRSGAGPRFYMNPSHFLHHFRELLCIQVPMAEVYLLRAIAPTFRERIMIVTAMANQCSG